MIPDNVVHNVETKTGAPSPELGLLHPSPEYFEDIFQIFARDSIPAVDNIKTAASQIPLQL